MATATTISDVPDRVDPWGFGPGGEIVVVPVAQWTAAPGTEPGTGSNAGGPSEPAAPAVAASPRDAAPSPASPESEPRRAGLRLSIPPQRVGLLALFGALVIAQAFYLGVSLFGAAPVPARGEVVLSSHPSGATVSEDGRSLGLTPLVVSLPAGRRALRLTAVGGATQSIVTDVVAGERHSRHVVFTAPAPAASATGTLHIDTGGAAAVISMDGASPADAPFERDDVPAGDHAVTIRFAHATVTRRVTVPAGERVSLVVDAPPAVPPAPAGPVSGWVHVEAPFDVQVFEDGLLLGTSASERLMLAAGRHRLVLVNAALGYRAEVPTAVAAGRTVAIAPDLPRAAVHVNATPWAEVFVDGRPLGETPLANVLLPLGAQTLVFRHPTLGERTATLTVRASGGNRVSVSFER
ncbi:MAG: PEGA domain-containing protein [Vicinamibacterales bacterium]